MKKSKKIKLTTKKIEIIVSTHIGIMQNLIIPNVSWGFCIHECDLLCVSKNGYLTEIEIKISLSDLKKDLEKRHGHRDDRIKYFYFAIPSKLAKHIEYIPARAGIFVINSFGRIFKIKNAIKNGLARSISIEDRYKLARLGTLRYWLYRQKTE
jgi:hypothetical protein